MRERQIGVIPERLEETIRPLAALADLANSHKDAISQIADSLFEQRRLFRNMQLSGAIYEEEKKKGKDKKDEKRDDLESFLERLDIFDNTNVAVVTNPLQLLGSLHNELLMQYVFLKDALGKLGNLKVNKILEGSTEYYNYSDFDERLLELLRARRALERKIGNRLDGIDLFKAPDKARNALENVAEDVSGFEQTKIVFLRTLASRLQGSDVRAIKCFRQAMQLPEAAELEAVASSLVNDYASIIMRVNETSEGMLKSIAGLQEKLQAIWRITEETYKALSGEYIGKSKNKVILNPLMTNVLKVIYADFPGADEVGKGATPSQVSKYSLLKAANLLRAVANPKVYALLKNPELVAQKLGADLSGLMNVYKHILGNVFDYMGSLKLAFSGIESPTEDIVRGTLEDALREAEEIAGFFSEMNFGDISAKKKTKSKSKLHPSVKKYQKMFGMLEEISNSPENEGLAKQKALEILDMHRRRRLEITKKPLEDRLEGTNYFEATQKGYGLLDVKPTNRPRVKFDDVIGDSFDEVKAHLQTIMAYNEFPSLYAATSPSKSVKSNILLIGPPGCGKTELFRAMASSKKIAVINASAANVRSMWYGNSEKNVLRLAEAAKKIREKTGKLVYVLIDEIDAVLGNPSDGSSVADVDTNVIKTFQEIMDGIRQYEGIVWCGATNNPERLSPAILRRFAYVDAVGELTETERAQLLKHYVSLGMPMSKDVLQDDFAKYVKVLDGAVGDTIRKVADLVHERLISRYIREHPREAKALEARLSRGGFDIKDLTKADRERTKREMARHAIVDSALLKDTVNYVAAMPAIQQEIKTAKEVYENARRVKDSIRQHLDLYS